MATKTTPPKDGDDNEQSRKRKEELKKLERNYFGDDGIGTPMRRRPPRRPGPGTLRTLSRAGLRAQGKTNKS